MPFLKSTSADDQGEWFLYGRDGDKEIRFKVRRLSPSKEYEIERRHSGRKGEIRWRKGDVIVPQDRDADLAAGIEKAVYCLIDSENCVVVPQDSEGAGQYAKALSAEVPVGKPLCLDGKWTREAADLFLSDELIVARRIVAKAKKMGIQAIEEEAEGKDDSSLS